MRYTAILLLLLFSGCQGIFNGYADEYMADAENNATKAAMQAAEDVGVPLDLYADLWDVNADPAKRLRLAGTLIGDMVRNSVAPESIVHVSLTLGAMTAYQYAPKAGDDP